MTGDEAGDATGSWVGGAVKKGNGGSVGDAVRDRDASGMEADGDSGDAAINTAGDVNWDAAVAFGDAMPASTVVATRDAA